MTEIFTLQDLRDTFVLLDELAPTPSPGESSSAEELTSPSVYAWRADHHQARPPRRWRASLLAAIMVMVIAIGGAAVIVHARAGDGSSGSARHGPSTATRSGSRNCRDEKCPLVVPGVNFVFQIDGKTPRPTKTTTPVADGKNIELSVSLSTPGSTLPYRDVTLYATTVNYSNQHKKVIAQLNMLRPGQNISGTLTPTKALFNTDTIVIMVAFEQSTPANGLISTGLTIGELAVH